MDIGGDVIVLGDYDLASVGSSCIGKLCQVCEDKFDLGHTGTIAKLLSVDSGCGGVGRIFRREIGVETHDAWKAGSDTVHSGVGEGGCAGAKGNVSVGGHKCLGVVHAIEVEIKTVLEVKRTKGVWRRLGDGELLVAVFEAAQDCRCRIDIEGGRGLVGEDHLGSDLELSIGCHVGAGWNIRLLNAGWLDGNCVEGSGGVCHVAGIGIGETVEEGLVQVAVVAYVLDVELDAEGVDCIDVDARSKVPRPSENKRYGANHGEGLDIELEQGICNSVGIDRSRKANRSGRRCVSHILIESPAGNTLAIQGGAQDQRHKDDCWF